MTNSKNVEKTVILLEILECPKKLFYRVKLAYKITMDVLHKTWWSDFILERRFIFLQSFKKKASINPESSSWPTTHRIGK